MRGLFRLLLIALLIVALPLRAIAAVTADSCLSHQGAGGPAHAGDAHDDGGDHGLHHPHGAAASGDAGSVADASICSDCASCCVGASLAAAAPALVAAHAPGAAAIPYLEHPASGRAPDALDRPPLAS